jgi:hypothetical protein
VSIVKPPPEPTNVLAIIARAAADPAVLPDKMRALLDMQKEIMAEEARIAFTRSFVGLQADLPTIRTDGKIEIREKVAGGERTGKVQQATPYATFQNIMKTVKPLLQKHGFILWFGPDVNPAGGIIIRGYLDHVKGHGKTCVVPLPLETSGSKNNVQGVGSSLSYGKRYAAISMLNIISHAKDDADLDGHVADAAKPKEPPKKISKAQAAELEKAVNDCGVGTDAFCDHYKINHLSDLTTDLFDQAITKCRTFKANQEAKAAHG